MAEQILARLIQRRGKLPLWGKFAALTEPATVARRRLEATRTIARQTLTGRQLSGPLTIGGLLLLSLLFYNKWATLSPLSSGDWGWFSQLEVKHWFPWESVWEPQGFGFNNFKQTYEFPIFSVAGGLAHLGIDWGLIEKIMYFWPYACLSLVSPWLLARELMGPSRWAILSSLLYASNTALLLESTVGHLFIAMGVALAPIVLYACIRSLRARSLAWSLAAGLLFALQAAYEVRIAYLTLGMALAYLAVLLLSERDLHISVRRLVLMGVALVAFLGCESYWLVPLLGFHGDRSLPTAASPWVAFMNLFHGIAGMDPFWNGGAPFWFQTNPVSPLFFVLPLLAFLSLSRRPTAEVVWLSCCALATAFLIKQTNPPAGGVYTWMFDHIPGWNFFREASKLYFVLAISYAILIPIALRGLFADARAWHPALRFAPILPLAAVVGVVGFSLFPLATGALGSTTRSIEEPSSFKAFRGILDNDRTYGRVLWLGAAWVQRAGGAPDLMQPQGEVLFHRFTPWSLRHPVVELLGTSGFDDPLARFCASPDVPFCYVDDKLLPYLSDQAAASYIVAPAGELVGRMPAGTTRMDLIERISSAFHQPTMLGTGAYAIAMWRVGLGTSPVLMAPGVACVAGAPEVTANALPALESLAIPAVFQPSSPASCHDHMGAVDVVPGTGGVYSVGVGRPFLVMARTTASTITVADGSTLTGRATLTKLPLMSSSDRSGVWRVYGPLLLGSGLHELSAPPTTSLGPLIESTPLALNLLSGRLQAQPAELKGLDPSNLVMDQPVVVESWLELRNSFDQGWQLPTATVHVRGDYLFNLFLTGPTKQAVLRYSTRSSEGLGVQLTVAWTVLIIVVGVTLLARRSAANHTSDEPTPRRPRVVSLAQALGLAGSTLMAFAVILYSIGWLGISSMGGTALLYLAWAMLLLALAAILHLASIRLPVRAQAGDDALG